VQQINFEVDFREKGTDSSLRIVRDEGYIPGILYGYNHANHPIKINQKNFSKHLKEHGKSGIFKINLGNEQVYVKINETQRDLIDGQVIHVDLQSIEMNKFVAMSVPLHFFGQALGVKNGGTVQQILRDVKVRALPTAIPESIHVNITELDIGDVLYLRQIALPPDVEVQHDLSTVVVTIVPPRASDTEEDSATGGEPEVVKARDGRGIDAAK